MKTPKAKGLSRARVGSTGGSAFSLEDAETIIGHVIACDSEGIGPSPDRLLAQIAAQHPHLVSKYKYVSWPNKAGQT